MTAQGTIQLINELQAHRIQLTDIVREVRLLTVGLSNTQWHWSPSAGDWSIARCLDHLNVVNSLVLPRLEEAIRDGQEKGWFNRGPFNYGLLDKLFVLGMEGGIPLLPMKSPSIFRPAERPDPQAAMERFLELQDHVDQCVILCDGLHLRLLQVTSPVSDQIKVSLGAYVAGVIAHERNHVRQMQAVRASQRFPLG